MRPLEAPRLEVPLPPMPARASVELSAVVAASTSPSPSLPRPRSLHRSTSSRQGPNIADADAAYAEVQAVVSNLAAVAADSQQCQHMEVLMDRVRSLYNSLHAAAECLAAKERENENLTQVLKELSETRAEAIRLKVLTLESYHKLQDEYARTLKSTQLAQQLSRSHCGTTQRLKSQLSDTREELHKARKQAASLQSRNTSLRDENEALRRELAAMERLNMMADCRNSLMQHFTSVRPLSLY